jgi:hypothetical protein
MKPIRKCARTKWDSLLGCPPVSAMLGLLFFFVVAQHAVPLQGAPTPPPSPAQQKSGAPRGTNASRELHKIGEALAKAVREKDVQALLALDRSDLRPQDEASLKNPKSDLYCYIFDSECITWGNGDWRSVYDKISQAQQLEIRASLWSSPYDRQLYGNLFFYDAATVSAKDLRSKDFLCKESPAKIASWKFRLEKGKWKPVTPLFDSETQACPASNEGDQ